MHVRKMSEREKGSIESIPRVENVHRGIVESTTVTETLVKTELLKKTK
jgi:hypothetical protein